MKTVKFANIGTSTITEQFIAGTKITGKLCHSAVYSRSREKGEAFAAKYGNLPVYTDINELAASDIDAVYVASPNSAHYEQCKLLLRNGKHVICEKSVSAYPWQVEELQDIASKNGLIFMEALMFMHLPQRELLQEAISRIGDVRHVNINFCQRSSRLDALQRGELPNIFNPQCETGALLDLGVYCIYPMLYYFGMPKGFTATSSLLHTGVDGTGTISLEYDGMIATLNYSKLCQATAPSHFAGDKGCVTVDSISQLYNIRFYDNKGNAELMWEGEDKPHLMSHEADMFADFINAPEKNREYYERCSKLMLDAARIMYDVRMKTGIIYKNDKNV